MLGKSFDKNIWWLRCSFRWFYVLKKNRRERRTSRIPYRGHVVDKIKPPIKPSHRHRPRASSPKTIPRSVKIISKYKTVTECFLLNVTTLSYRPPKRMWEVNDWGGVPCDHYPWCIAPHCTDAWTCDLNVQAPPTSDNWWPSPENCSNFRIYYPSPFPLVLTAGGCWSTYRQRKLLS